MQSPFASPFQIATMQNASASGSKPSPQPSNPFGGPSYVAQPNPFGAPSTTASSSKFASMRSNNSSTSAASSRNTPPTKPGPRMTNNSNCSRRGNRASTTPRPSSAFGAPTAPAQSATRRKDSFGATPARRPNGFGTSAANKPPKSIPTATSTKFGSASSAPRPRSNNGSGFSVPSGVNGPGAQTQLSPPTNSGAQTRSQAQATKIDLVLRRGKIFRPSLGSVDPGDPSKRAVVEKHWRELKEYRAKVRTCLEEYKIIDDDEPKKLEEAIDFLGTCEARCPYFEAITRIVENRYDHRLEAYERPDGSRWPSPALMVKRFARSSAGRENPLPEDVRSAATLRMTLDYLLDDVLVKNDLPGIVPFMWDRLREIRIDFTYQQAALRRSEIIDHVYCLEHIARYHALAIHKMAGIANKPSEYSEAQEKEQLAKTLLSLKEAYEDCEARGIECENEPEFRAYYVLYHAQSTKTFHDAQNLGRRIWKSTEFQTAVSLVESVQSTWTAGGRTDITQNTSAKFFSIVESSAVSYTMACIAEMHFNDVRKTFLKTIFNSYMRQREQTKDWTVEKLNKYLRLDDDEDVYGFVKAYGLGWTEIEGQECLAFSGRNSVVEPHPQRAQGFSQKLVEFKRGEHSLHEAVRKKLYCEPPMPDISQWEDDGTGLFFPILPNNNSTSQSGHKPETAPQVAESTEQESLQVENTAQPPHNDANRSIFPAPPSKPTFALAGASESPADQTQTAPAQAPVASPSPFSFGSAQPAPNQPTPSPFASALAQTSHNPPVSFFASGPPTTNSIPAFSFAAPQSTVKPPTTFFPAATAKDLHQPTNGHDTDPKPSFGFPSISSPAQTATSSGTVAPAQSFFPVQQSTINNGASQPPPSPRPKHAELPQAGERLVSQPPSSAPLFQSQQNTSPQQNGTDPQPQTRGSNAGSSASFVPPASSATTPPVAPSTSLFQPHSQGVALPQAVSAPGPAAPTVFAAPKVAFQPTPQASVLSPAPQPTQTPEPPRALPTVHPAVSASKALSKSEKYNNLARWVLEGENGLLDHFVAHDGGYLVRDVWNAFVAEEERKRQEEEDRQDREKADSFRQRSVATTYFYRWQNNAKNLRYRRNGIASRQKRKAHFQNKLAESRAASLAASQASSPPQSVQEDSVEEQLRASGILDGVGIRDPVRAIQAISRGRSQSTGVLAGSRKRPVVEANVPNDSGRAQKKARSTNNTPVSNKKRSRPEEVSHQGGSAQKKVRSTSSTMSDSTSNPHQNQFHASAPSPLTRTLSPDATYLLGGSRARYLPGYYPGMKLPKLKNGMRDDYFRLKARGIETLSDGTPDAGGWWDELQAAKRRKREKEEALERAAEEEERRKKAQEEAEELARHKRLVSYKIRDYSPAAKRFYESYLSEPSEEPESRQASPVVNKVVKKSTTRKRMSDGDAPLKAAKKTKTTYTGDDDDEEELFARARRVREQMEEGEQWFREESRRMSGSP